MLTVLLFAFPVFVLASGTAQINNEIKPNLIPKKLVSIYDNPGYQHLIDRLENVVKREATLTKNHFFIAKYPEGERSYTYMVWREGRHMWILNIAGGDNPEYWDGVEHPRSGTYINFDKDVVASQAEIGSSSFLVDQSWVNERVFETVIDGDLIIIE